MYSMVIATMAITFVVQAVLRNLSVFGSVTGIFGIPRLPHSLLVSYCIVVVVGFLIYRLERSRTGRAMAAVSANQDLARSLGASPIRVSIVLQLLSAGIGGIAGGLYAFAMGMIRPSSFGFSVLLYIWTMLFVGGHQTMWGALVAAPLLWTLSQFLPSYLAPYTNIVFGVALAVTLLARPNGLVTQRIVSAVSSGVRGGIRGAKNLLARTVGLMP
jgi:branched-chain amino acid transport system permease protein